MGTPQLGIAIFVMASLAGGLGQNVTMLIVARTVQGVGAALTAPNALALITTPLREHRMRDAALSLHGVSPRSASSSGCSSAAS